MWAKVEQYFKNCSHFCVSEDLGRCSTQRKRINDALQSHKCPTV